ncbi:MAG: cold-shock protein [Rhodospirillales bacterium]|nr:MAG: cold-shock protein [Rhodospirillales bacterium]
MATGTVKWFNETKGYGFISPDEGGQDAFVHISEVQRSGLHRLSEGQRIAFTIREEARGLKAVDLSAPD